MNTVMKIIINTRHDNDFNTSISFEHIVSSEEDAKEIGVQDAKLMKAYFEGLE